MGMISLLAKSRLRYYKSRTILTMIAIFLTTMLLNGIVTSSIGIIDMNRQVYVKQGNWHAGFLHLDSEKVDLLGNHLEVESLEISEIVAEINYGKMSGYLGYSKIIREGIYHATGNLIEGHEPETADEICGSAAFFERMGVEPKIGSQITITFRPSGVNGLGAEQTRTFTICGLVSAVDISDLDIDDSRVTYSAAVSEAFVHEILSEDEREYRAMIRVYGEEDLSHDEMADKVNALAQDIGVAENSISLNDLYLYMVLEPDTEMIITISIICGLVVCFAMLVIYSIYYVNVITDIQEIGKIKALGAGDKQIRKLFMREGTFCSLIAVPTGLLLGFLIPYIALPPILNWVLDVSVMAVTIDRPRMFSLPLTLLVAAVAFAAVYLSLIKPIRIAAKVSPITAIRYQESSTNRKMRSGYKRLGEVRLCLANLSRNKKRTIITMLSMGLSWVLFMGIAGILSSMTPENVANDVLKGAQFRIHMYAVSEDTAYPENTLNHVQMRNLFSAKMVEEIKALDGVDEVNRKITMLARVEDAPETYYSLLGSHASFGTVEEGDIKSLQKDLKRGHLDYEEMTAGNGIIWTTDYWLDESGLSIGDQVNLTLYDGDKEIPFTGTLVASVSSSGSDFLVTKATFDKIGVETDPTTDLLVTMKGSALGSAYEKRYEAAKETIAEMIADEEKLSLYSWDEEKELARMQTAIIRYPVYALLLLIAIISLMSLINTMIISITTRKRELGMLQAVGLSDRQLVRMLSGEGLFFTAGTLVLAFTVGNALGYWLFNQAKEIQMIGITDYHYPLLETLLLCIALIIGQILIVAFVKKRVGKESLIDRIRSGE